MNSLRMRGLAVCFILAAFAISACNNYHTIGSGPNDPQFTTPGSASKPRSSPNKSNGLPVPQPTPTTDTTVYCRLSDLTPVATWADSGDGLTGSLTLANYWSVPCTLKGQPILGVTDDSGVGFNVQVTEPPRSSVPPRWLFKPGAVAEVSFTWLNWCFGEKGTMKVSVTMAGEGAPELYVPVRDSNGNLVNTTPACTAQNARSTLTVGNLKLIK